MPPERVFAIARAADRRRRAGDRLRRHDRHGQPAPRCGSSSRPRARRWATRSSSTAHFHNTRGQGLANVLAALDAGVRELRVELRRAGRLPGAARARPATSRPRTWCRCCTRWASRRASRSSGCVEAAARRAGGARPAARLARAHRRAGGVELAPLTTLRLGGPAARRGRGADGGRAGRGRRATPALVLAGGSNVVSPTRASRDRRADRCTRGVERDGARLTVAAGEDWDALVARCVAEGLQGFECLSGIPGSVGATPIQNVGAYGQEVAETVESVRVLDRATGRVEDMSAAECGFVYRGACSSTTTAASCSRSPSGCARRPVGPAALRRAGAGAGRAGRRQRAARRRARGGARAAPRQGDGHRPGRPRLGQRRLVLHQPDPAHAARADGAPALAGAGRPRQDLGGVADRAGRLPPRLRRRPRRDLDQAHARARQPRRRRPPRS